MHSEKPGGVWICWDESYVAGAVFQVQATNSVDCFHDGHLRTIVLCLLMDTEYLPIMRVKNRGIILSHNALYRLGPGIEAL